MITLFPAFASVTFAATNMARALTASMIRFIFVLRALLNDAGLRHPTLRVGT
jgi:hypothetical protein